MFGDWNDDGHVSPAEGWGTLLLTGVIEDGDTGGDEDPDGGGGDGCDGCSKRGCGIFVLAWIAIIVLVTIIGVIHA